MIDIKILRENPELIKQNCAKRKYDVDVDAMRELDQQYLKLVRETEFLRSERNRLSKECQTNPAAREQVKAMKVELAEKEKLQEELKAQVDEKLTWLPNFQAPDTPDGESDADNVEVKVIGQKPNFSFQPRDHQAIGEILGIIDTQRGAKVAQSGFYYWVGKGAMLTQAMYFWAQKELVKRGFTMMMSPCAAKARTLFGTGYLPFFKDQIYPIGGEDLCLIGTAEQTLVGFHADETMDGAKLPERVTAYTPCFRTEAGSYGKEARGIFRVHQFHKVEQIIFCRPEDSPKCHEEALANEEYLLQQLGIPYHVVNVCIGDLGAPAYKKYDCEAWFPGYNGYREVTSNSNLTDFQSRRLNIRYKDADGNKGFVHTISATGLTDRVVCAMLENFQREDGSVVVPEVLRPFTGFDVIEPAK
ncbi:MAG: serine--tRNA ligase [Lentisphaeria bacterium]|nr:serine--tRNA ligase [Lentisphaeria bacterium]